MCKLTEEGLNCFTTGDILAAAGTASTCREEVILRKKDCQLETIKIISSKSKRNCQLETEKYCLERNLELKFEIYSQFKVGKQIDFALKLKLNSQDACSQQLA